MTVLLKEWFCESARGKAMIGLLLVIAPGNGRANFSQPINQEIPKQRAARNRKENQAPRKSIVM
jgi:hypothetical protein